jgi:hypothetical protein
VPVSNYFASTFADARGKFRDAAHAAGCEVRTYDLPKHHGPRGEELAIDVANLGSPHPESMLVLISGTHGVEGFCGSGCQVGFLSDQLYSGLPDKSAVLLVHALNPYGFAWHRRVNEDNIDLNRNFQNFSTALPSSSAYEQIHDWLIPAKWDKQHRDAADAKIRSYIAQHSQAAFQAAVSSGQYTRPTGLFYGGAGECWSNRTLRHILRKHVPQHTRLIVVLDFHTGLGPIGYGEPIYVGTESGFQRAKDWFGSEVTKLHATDSDAQKSVSALVTGDVSNAFHDPSHKWEVLYLALEYGTKPIWDVLTALRADHWLHASMDRPTEMREEIKAEIRDAFYVDRPDWKAAVYGRAADFAFRASRGLGEFQKSGQLRDQSF